MWYKFFLTIVLFLASPLYFLVLYAVITESHLAVIYTYSWNFFLFLLVVMKLHM